MRKVLSIDALVLGSTVMMCERNVLTPDYLRELLLGTAQRLGFKLTEADIMVALGPLRRVYYSDFSKRRMLL